MSAIDGKTTSADVFSKVGAAAQAVTVGDGERAGAETISSVAAVLAKERSLAPHSGRRLKPPG
ncbi:hypothetical protein GJ654_06170 [Rhodoblastus acidophilus]|uniref:Uncharacterized protein n=1 Tax=Rhodoblastus acidophilus TaxID=1074 RepID=A0A6N8DJH0_RHOAC|nr:hypothetical protein [Rhodoblastus acidophilus]MCW2273334.1 5,10-methylenetetrahydrofolate reductase [Rhodoblastus acidophilus]MTV30579.1 hypothetical protein [Rhodoblastus acidophilus]